MISGKFWTLSGCTKMTANILNNDFFQTHQEPNRTVEILDVNKVVLVDILNKFFDLISVFSNLSFHLDHRKLMIAT